MIALGGPIAFVMVASAHVTFGFWRGAELADPDRRLEGDGTLMRHVKLRAKADIDEPRFRAWLVQGARLNAAHGDPAKKRGRA